MTLTSNQAEGRSQKSPGGEALGPEDKTIKDDQERNPMSKADYSRSAELSLLTNNGTSPRMTKRYSMTDGKLVKNGSSFLAAGLCKVEAVPSLTELYDLMNNLGTNQALAYGVPKNGIKVEQRVYMVPEAKKNGGFARGKDYMEFRPGKRGIMLIDHDPSKWGRSYTPDELAKLLGEMIPAFADLQMLSRASSSNGIYNGDELLTNHDGTHLYLMVDDASKIPEVGEIIHKRAWLNGHGHIELSEVGSMLVRSVVDACVWQAERLDYAAAPIVEQPLVRKETKPAAMNPKGRMVMFAGAVKPLTNDEELDYQDLINDKKSALKPQATKTRKKRINEIVDEQVGKDDNKKVKAEAKRVLEIALDHKILDHDFLITSNNGKRASVASVLAGPQRYHGMSIPDPIFTQYGNDKAIIYSDQEYPIIHSFAHGEHIYRLVNLSYWPKIILLGAELLPVPKFDYAMLPDGFAKYVEDEAVRQETFPDFISISIMIALATVIGKKVGIHPKAHDNWVVICNLWGMAVGLPSANKSPSISAGTKPLDILVTAAKERHRDACAAYAVSKVTYAETKSLAKTGIKNAVSGKDPAKLAAAEQVLQQVNTSGPVEPTEERFIVHDATVEKLGELLNENPNGLLQLCDELSGLIKRLEQADKGMDRGFMLQAFDGGGSYSYDRIQRGSLYIESVCMSFLGAMPPSALAAMLNSALSNGSNDDGMFQRFQLAVYPDPIDDWKPVDKAPDKAATAQVQKIFERLHDVEPKRDDDGGVACVRFDKDAQKIFDQWRVQHETQARNPSMHHAVASHFLKYRSLFASLALIINEADVGHYETVTEQSAKKAEMWCDYLSAHALRVYGSAISPEIHNAKVILENRNKFPDGFTARDVTRKGMAGMRKVGNVNSALHELIECGYLRSLECTAGSTGGRSTTTYSWNPVLSINDDVS